MERTCWVCRIQPAIPGLCVCLEEWNSAKCGWRKKKKEYLCARQAEPNPGASASAFWEASERLIFQFTFQGLSPPSARLGEDSVVCKPDDTPLFTMADSIIFRY